MTATGKAGQAAGAGSRVELINVLGEHGGSVFDYDFSAVTRVRNNNSEDYYFLYHGDLEKFLSCKPGLKIDIFRRERQEGCTEVAGRDIPDSKKAVLSQITNLPIKETSDVIRRLRSLLANNAPGVEITSRVLNYETAYDVTVPGRTESVARYFISSNLFYYGGASCGENLHNYDNCYMKMNDVSSSHLEDVFAALREDLKKAVQQQIARRDEGK